MGFLDVPIRALLGTWLNTLSGDSTTKVATHAGLATAHPRVQVTDAFVNRTGHGAPTDALFTSPVDGMEYVDLDNARHYVRIGGTWVYAALNSPAVWTPASIAGLKCWCDASQIAGKNDGDSIAQWDDLSGVTNHLVQATGGNQPVYKTGIQNGKPVVRFNGTSSYLHATIASMAAPYTIVLVGRASQGTGSNECFFSSSTSATLEGRLAGYYTMNSGSPNYAGLSTGTKANSFKVLTAVFSTTPVLRVNGVANTGSFAAVNATTTLVFGEVGSGDWLNGDIGEIAVYDKALSADEIVAVESYLA